MPALDPSRARVGAYHISDQNRANPIKTLCGQALDKENVSYWSAPENFQHATCKVCRGIYFDEKWTGEPNIQKPQLEVSAENIDPPRVNLFSDLEPVINEHGEKTNGS